jgi:UDP-glucose 4-epimerase
VSALAGKTVVVTGGRGFLGTALVELLKDVDCRIVRIVRTPAPAIRDSRANVIDLTGDVRDASTWRRALDGADVVFHLAAQTSAAVAQADPDRDFADNVAPVVNLLDACRLAGATPIVLFAGTVTQAGVPVSTPVDESHADNPPTVYDAHKLLAENHVKDHARQGIVRGASLRLANLYGPGPRSRGAGRGVLNTMIRRAVAGEALTVYGSGAYVRDYLYVRDAALAFIAAAEGIEKLNGGHWVIGSGEGHTINDAFNAVAARVAERTGRRVAVEHVEPREPLSALETRNFVADSSRFRAATLWRARCPFPEGIDRTIEACLCAS